MKYVLLSILLVAAPLLDASSLDDFQTRFNELGVEIEQEVRDLRAENSDAILAMNQKMLRELGNYTIAARDMLLDTNLTIQVEEWLNEDPEAQECFDFAYQIMDLYSWLTTWDIGWCAIYTSEEINAESQYHFFSHAHYIMRAGSDGIGQVLDSYGQFGTDEERLNFVEEEFDWLSYLWGNYQLVLKQEIEGHEVTGDWIATELQYCLEVVMDDVAYWMNYVENDLEYCLENVGQIEERVSA